MPPDLADLRLTYAQRALASGSLQIYEQLFDIEGDLRHEEVRTVPMNDQEVLVMIRDITDRKLAEIQLNQYKDMISNMKDGVALVDRNYIYQVVNQVYLDRTQKQWNEIVGHSVAELHGETVFRTMIQPRFDQCLAGEIQEYEDWFDFATIGRRFVRVTYSPYFELDGSINGVVVTTYDRTALKQAESQIEIQNAILERIAKAEPLADILTALLQAMEWPLDGAFCSVMICDQDGRLHNGVAPRLPESYLQAIEGVIVGEGVGSCGTAAFRQQAVIVSDIATDPLWQDYRSLALEHGLKACWSMPIFASDGKILGVFGVYYPEICAPQPQALEAATLAANIAGIAIEQEQARAALAQLNQELERRVDERTAALQTSEERWQLALRGTNDGIWDWDLTTNKIFFSSRWKQMRGFTEDEIGDSPDECLSRIHPDDYERVMAAVDAHFVGRIEFFEVEYRAQRKNGRYMWVLDRAQVLRNQAGQIVRMSGSDTDITQRKLAETALWDSERRYATLATAAPVAIFWFDSPSNCVYVNEQWSQMTGRPVESALGQGWIEALHPEDRDRLLAAWANDQAQSSPGNPVLTAREGRHLRPDGTVTWFYAKVAQEIDESGQVVGYVGTLTDITERKLAEEALQQSEQRYRALMDGASDAILLADSQGNLIETNQQAERLLGYSRAEMTCLHISQIHPPEALEAAKNHFKTVVQHNLGPTLESLVLRKDGSQVPVDITSSYLELNGERIAQGIFRDISDRKLVEQENIRLRERLQFVLSASPAVIFTCRTEGDFGATFISDNIANVAGYSSAEFLAESSFWADHVHPDDLSRAFDGLPQLFEQDYYSHDYRFRHQAGHYLWVHDELHLVRDQQGNPAEIVGYLADVTDRKRAELALQSSELRFRQMFDSSVVGMIFADFQGRILDANDYFLQMVGYSRAELEAGAIHWDAMTPAEHTAADYAAMEHLMQHGMISPWEKEYYRKDGSRIPVLIGAALLPGSTDQTICVVVDISARKQAEMRLQRQSEREHLTNSISQRIRASLNLQEILSTTVSEVHQVLQSDRVLVYRVLPDGTGKAIAESVSPGWPVILDQIFPEEIFPKQNYERYVKGRFFALSDREVGPVLPCLADFLKEMQVRAKLVVPIIQNQTLWGLVIAHQCDAPRQWQAWEIDLLRQLSGQLAIAIQQSELYAQLQDSHQQLSHTNADLLRATRLKDEFLANMSHELRTPLNAILGMSEGLQEEVFGPLNDRQKHSLSTIERSGQHLLSLINDILELSKISAGKLELELSIVSISELCESSLIFVKQQAFKKQIRLSSTIPKDLGSIAVDERRMRQVLINLLTNAVKFTPIGGRVTLQVYLEPLEINLAERISVERVRIPSPVVSPEAKGAYCQLHDYSLCFSVIDTGIGIAAADQPKLFQPFVQIDGALNRQYEGTGLGLAMVKQIVELHGGLVSLRSELGNGSCFTASIPYMSSLSQQRSSILPSRPSTHHDPDLLLSSPSSIEETSDASTTCPLILLAEDNEANISRPLA